MSADRLISGLMPNRITFGLFLTFVLALAGCASGVKTILGKPLSQDETYLKGIMRTVNVGDFMTSSASFLERDIIILQTKITANTTHRGKVRELVAAPGKYTMVREHEDGKFYEASKGSLVVNAQERPGGIFISNNSIVPNALYWTSSWTWQAVPDSTMAMHMADFEAKPELTNTATIFSPDYNSGFVSSLTYAGMASGQIKFSYREFKDGLARDAFTQEVALDYEPEKVYVYKSAQFIVHHADTTEISFTLLQSL
ncbi:hypothetical protein [Gilvimarinus sp. 1_MG-2023]|uniref:hypothetical protein n=1 Tax=Gilvimarinus sp. 1_MG-2023 TaxID=3062638 RepID=UPI0026E36C83|nr:hypothetical protein [Gilvimarinus sp. 1_MG-2023]MDO6747829.1 hypothetical protein [Gilvimarinus sp. 1_MG-2023]